MAVAVAVTEAVMRRGADTAGERVRTRATAGERVPTRARRGKRIASAAASASVEFALGSGFAARPTAAAAATRGAAGGRL